MKLVTAAVVFDEKGRVLLTKRKKGDTLEGYWEFPGGKVENGESPLQCIEREIEEELSVKAKAKEIIGESIYKYKDGTIKLIGILTELSSKDFKLTVHEEAHWVPLHELQNYRLLPADIELAKKIQSLYPRKTVLP